jgi:mRNA-degrading endonuclease RelE of RelBE toxin-antitoxin system
MNHDGPRWDFQKPKDFQEQILKLPQSIRSKLTQVMTELSNSHKPNQLGNKKKAKYGVYYTIRLSESYRIAYASSQVTRRIEIYRVGDHEQVHNKD